MFHFSGKRPAHLGVREGQLAPCSRKPNCVSSQAMPSSPHYVRPFSFEGDRADAMTRVLAVLMEEPRCTIVTQSKDYIHAEFSTAFFGFVDDVELFLPVQGDSFHIRSASRLGYSDLGINRARVEALREAFDSAD